MFWYYCPHCRHSIHREADTMYCTNCGFIHTAEVSICLHVMIESDQPLWPSGALLAEETLLKAARRICAKHGIAHVGQGHVRHELVKDGTLHLLYRVQDAPTQDALQQELLGHLSSH